MQKYKKWRLRVPFNIWNNNGHMNPVTKYGGRDRHAKLCRKLQSQK